MFVSIAYVPVLTSEILKFALAFLSSCFPKKPKMSGEKCKYFTNERWNEKHYSSLLKGFY